jgi:hypothetical protein
MKKRLFFLMIAPFVLMTISGCAPLIIGGAVGALGGYAASNDTIQGETDKSYDSLWDTAIMISRARGTIKREDSLKGYIEMEERPNKVYIRLLRLTHATTRLKVAVRKHHLPNLELAQDIFLKIMEQAR